MRWYKQDGGLFDRIWTKDPKAVSLYVYLHCRAYVNDSRLYGQIIRRGSCLIKYDDVSERIGLSIDEIRLRLKLLADCGEVVLKRTNRGVIVTVCDYDVYNVSEGLFETNNPIQPQSNPNHINIEYNNIEGRDIRSRNTPSNNERESRKALVLEIKDIYNKVFDGKLIEWKRLSEKMIMKVDTCIMRYGRQSVDMVFDQVMHEPFSLGDNNTGFKADFDFIFRLDQYEKYLSRYNLRMTKKDEPQKQKQQKKVQAPKAKPQQLSILDEATEQTPQEKRRIFLLSWVKSERDHPTERGQNILTASFNNGELQELGIDWKPNN